MNNTMQLKAIIKKWQNVEPDALGAALQPVRIGVRYQLWIGMRIF